MTVRLKGRTVLDDGRVVLDPGDLLHWALEGLPIGRHLGDDPESQRVGRELAAAGVEVGPITETWGPRASEGEIEAVRAMVWERCPDDDRYLGRLEQEWEWFVRSGNVAILPRLSEWLETAERTGVVVGTGRGSSCASLVLYLLGLHMVDPVEWDIPFSEYARTPS